MGRSLKEIERLKEASVDGKPGSDVLTEAHRLVNTDRGEAYGPPHEDYAKVAEIYAALTGVKLTVLQAIMFPLAMKLARIRTNTFSGRDGWHRDSVVDAAGYLACLAMAREATGDAD